MRRPAALVAALLLGTAAAAPAATPLPACLARGPGQTNQQAVAAAGPGDLELLARLVYAEAASTGFGEDPAVHEGIAWGVMNRVRLAAASPSLRRRFGEGVGGVIFQKGQFNPAVSERSPFSRMFLCPEDGGRWALARSAAERALGGEGNPLLGTDWERRTGLSLVVNFYYPRSVQARGALAPWESSRELAFIGDVSVSGRLLPAERVRFYRLVSPPEDVPGEPPPGGTGRSPQELPPGRVRSRGPR